MALEPIVSHSYYFPRRQRFTKMVQLYNLYIIEETRHEIYIEHSKWKREYEIKM